VAATAAPLLQPPEPARLAALATAGEDSVHGRVLIVDRSGAVVADSAGSAQVGADYSSRPEIAAALRGRRFQESRHSATLGENLLATSSPVLSGRRVIGAVRVTQRIAAVHRAVRRSIAGLVLIAAVVLVIGLTAGWLIARQLARPLRRLESTAGEIAHGRLERRAPVEGTREQRSLARSFNEMTERLSLAVRSQEEFVADASHQLRTPLTGLRLRLEEVQAASDGRPETQEEIRAALGELDRLSEVVDELLLLSYAGGRDAPPDEVDLADVAHAAQQRWHARATARGIALDCSAEHGGHPVTAARADVDRALDALVENAVLYSPPGGTVRIGASRGRVEVLDSGPGVASDEQEQVFERFHRGRAGRAGPAGTGLGLPIARELMRRWGAQVSLANRQEGGARATIAFDVPGSGTRR
jgi:signal transduction histidine kinase